MGCGCLVELSGLGKAIIINTYNVDFQKIKCTVFDLITALCT